MASECHFQGSAVLRDALSEGFALNWSLFPPEPAQGTLHAELHVRDKVPAWLIYAQSGCGVPSVIDS